MQNIMKTSKQQTLPFTGDKSTFLPAVFRASRSVKLEKERVQKMIATSGRECLRSFEKFSRYGLWARTFMDLLIGTGDWYSSRSVLTWKLKGTKYNRLYFQLYPSTLPTEGTGYGLLPTVVANPSNRKLNENGESVAENGQKWGISIQQMAVSGLLPTPMACEGEKNMSCSSQNYISNMAREGLLPTPREAAARGNTSNDRNKGNLEDAIARMLPTPATRDYKGDRTLTDGENVTQKGEKMGLSLEQTARIMSGTPNAPSSTSQLNPRFVAEMMGFPTDWTELPFLNGETNQSKHTETQ
jgi:hypothetical protein